MTGAGWEHYCSTPVAGREFKIWAVTDDGRAEIPLISAGDGAFYMAWVSPIENDELYGTVVKQHN